MVDKELVSRKLSQLQSYVEELERAEDISWEKYRSDLRSRAFVERFIHLAIEETIDVANHFVSFYRWREPTSFRDLFSILHEHGIIPWDHLLTFQNMAAVRSMLAHRDESMDEQLVFGIFRKHPGDFHLFIALIGDWVEQQP